MSIAVPMVTFPILPLSSMKVFSGEVAGAVMYLPSLSTSQSMMKSPQPFMRGYAVLARYSLSQVNRKCS